MHAGALYPSPKKSRSCVIQLHVSSLCFGGVLEMFPGQETLLCLRYMSGSRGKSRCHDIHIVGYMSVLARTTRQAPRDVIDPRMRRATKDARKPAKSRLQEPLGEINKTGGLPGLPETDSGTQGGQSGLGPISRAAVLPHLLQHSLPSTNHPQ